MSCRIGIWVVVAVVFGLLSAPGVAWGGLRQDDAPRYTAVDIGVIKDHPGTAAFAINASGVVVGQGYDAASYRARAVVYRNEKIRALIKGEKGISAAQDINASGQVVGFSQVDGPPVAMQWDGDEATVIGEFPGGCMAMANNDAGVVVGWLVESGGSTQRPFVWKAGELTRLPLLGDGERGTAYDINEDGLVVGDSTLAPAEAIGMVAYHAAVWEDGGVRDLGTIGGDFSQASGINAGGKIVGRSTTGAGQFDYGPGTHAVLWDGDEIVDLGTLADGDVSEAFGVNSEGAVVGRSNFETGEAGGEMHAFLWSDGTIYDLNDLVDGGSGVVLHAAYDINDDGLIVAVGRIDGNERGFVLTPVEA